MEKTRRFLQNLLKTDKQDGDDQKDEIISSMTQYWMIAAMMLVLVIVLFIWNFI